VEFVNVDNDREIVWTCKIYKCDLSTLKREKSMLCLSWMYEFLFLYSYENGSWKSDMVSKIIKSKEKIWPNVRKPNN